MGKGEEDRRVRKTRELLHDALVSLMVQKNYESITAQEIINRANVGRTTFYAHFTDKDDLLIWAFRRLQEGLEAAQAEPRDVPMGSCERLVAFGLPTFEHLYRHRPIHKAMMSSQARTIAMEYIPIMVTNLIRDKSRTKAEGQKKGDIEIPYDLLVHFVVSTFVSLVSWWLDSPDPLPPKEIHTIFRALVLSDLTMY